MSFNSFVIFGGILFFINSDSNSFNSFLDFSKLYKLDLVNIISRVPSHFPLAFKVAILVSWSMNISISGGEMYKYLSSVLLSPMK